MFSKKMRVVYYLQGKWIAMKRPTTLESHQSNTNCHDAQKRPLENSEMVSTRLTDNYVNDNSQQLTSSEFGIGSGVHENLVAPSDEWWLLNNQAKQQEQTILELQKQIDNLTEIQQHQKLLEEGVKRQKQAQVAQETVVKEIVRPRVQWENADAEMISMDDSSLLCASDQLNSRRSESVQHCIQKRIITRSHNKVAADVEQHRQLEKVSRCPRETNRVNKSGGSSRKKKQVRPIIRLKRCNSAVEKDQVVREKSKTSYPCSECGKRFRLKSHLVIHSMIHTGEKPFKCGECGALFRQSGHLTVHQRIHSGEKPFKCQICNVDFNQKCNLFQHLLIHTNEKPFACDICQKSFRQKTILSNHMNIHSGLKPHKCNVCKKTFRQKSNLSAHQKVHH